MSNRSQLCRDLDGVFCKHLFCQIGFLRCRTSITTERLLIKNRPKKTYQYLSNLFIFGRSPRYISLPQSRLAQYYQDCNGEALVLVISTALEIFYQVFNRKALHLVISTEWTSTALEIFYQFFNIKALLMVIPTALEIS